MNRASIYFQHTDCLGKMFWKGPDSRNSEKMHAKMLLTSEYIGNQNFCFLQIIVNSEIALNGEEMADFLLF